MNKDIKKHLIITFINILIVIISIVVINDYPVGDWVSGPLTLIFMLYPILVIEIIASIFLFCEIKPNLFIGIQILFSVLSIIIVLHYLSVHKNLIYY